MAPDTNNISTKDIFTDGLLDALRRFNAKERFYYWLFPWQS